MYAEGLDILKEGEKLNQKLGDQNPEGLSAIYQNMWLAYAMQGRRPEAKQALDKSEAMLRQAAPDEMHPNFVQTYLSKSLYATTNEEKLKFTKRAFVIAANVYTPDRGPYNLALNEMAETAAALIKEKVKTAERKAVLADMNEMYLLHKKNVSARYGEEAWQEKAEVSALFGDFTVEVDMRTGLDYYRSCIEMARSRSVRSPQIAHCFFNAAQILDLGKLGSFAEAEPLYSQALDMYNLVIGLDNPETQDVRKRLVQAYLDARQPAKARELAEKLAGELTAQADFPHRAAYIKDLRALAERAKTHPDDPN